MWTPSIDSHQIWVVRAPKTLIFQSFDFVKEISQVVGFRL